MPGFERAELSAELKVVPPSEGEDRGPLDAAKRAAGESGLAHEASPETIVLAGGRDDVLGAVGHVVEAALDAGAHTIEMRIEAEGDAPRFDG